MKNRCIYLMMMSLAMTFSSLGCSFFPSESFHSTAQPIQPRMTHSPEIARNAPPIVVRSQSSDTTPYDAGGQGVGAVSPQDDWTVGRSASRRPGRVKTVGYNDNSGWSSNSSGGFPAVDSYGTGAMPRRARSTRYSAPVRSQTNATPRYSAVAPSVTGASASPLAGDPRIGQPDSSVIRPPANTSPQASAFRQPTDGIAFGHQPNGGLSARLPEVVEGGIAPQNNPPVVESYPYIDLNAIVHEARTGRLMVGAGVNSDAGLVGSVVIDEQNFDWRRLPTSFRDVWNGKAWRGGGQRLRVEAQPGTYVQRYLVSFTEPYFMDTRVSLGLRAHYFDRRYFDWEERRTGGRISLGYQFEEDWSMSTSFRAETIEVHNPRVIPVVPELATALGVNDEYAVKFVLAHDTRDSAFMPTQGHSIELGFEQVFGTFQYPIATVDARQYFTLKERINGSGRHVLSVGGKLGIAGDDTPVYANFFAGGFSTMRGFAFRGASPKSGDVIVGGEFQLLGTAEYMFPITADDMLYGVVFVDAGTTEEDVDIDLDDFRVAPGFGLRISHPGLGPAPIALDLAFPVAHEDGDTIRNFTFFIGVRR